MTFLLFVFSDVSLLVLSVMGVFLLGCLLSGLANASIEEDPFMQSSTSPKSHIYMRGGSLSHGLLNVKFL